MLEILVAVSACAAEPDGAMLRQAVHEALTDEIQHGLSATRDQDMDAYLARIPDDYFHIEEDGRRVDKAALRAMQEQAWAIIPRTNRIEQAITGFELSCDGQTATIWTDQLWDRQMLGRDGETEFNIVTTQMHREIWRETNDGWQNVSLEELGGTLTIDGELQS